MLSPLPSGGLSAVPIRNILIVNAVAAGEVLNIQSLLASRGDFCSGMSSRPSRRASDVHHLDRAQRVEGSLHVALGEMEWDGEE